MPQPPAVFLEVRQVRGLGLGSQQEAPEASIVPDCIVARVVVTEQPSGPGDIGREERHPCDDRFRDA